MGKNKAHYGNCSVACFHQSISLKSQMLCYYLPLIFFTKVSNAVFYLSFMYLLHQMLSNIFYGSSWQTTLFYILVWIFFIRRSCWVVSLNPSFQEKFKSNFFFLVCEAMEGGGRASMILTSALPKTVVFSMTENRNRVSIDGSIHID